VQFADEKTGGTGGTQVRIGMVSEASSGTSQKYKSDAIVVGFSATPSQRSFKLTSRFMGLFFINGFNCNTNKKLHS